MADQLKAIPEPDLWKPGKRLEQLKEELKHNHFTLVEVIDAVVEINGIIGVGLISLGDDLKNYCYQKAGNETLGL